MTIPIALDGLVQRFDGPLVRAIVLMGSYSRDEAGPYSDIDFVRFTDESEQGMSDDGNYLYDRHLVVVSTVTFKQVEQWFSEPEAAVGTIMGVRRARILLDREGYFAGIRARAEAFEWDQVMQERANRWASKSMVGWIEEVHKGLEGLRRHDIGRLLNASHGLSWGLNHVMQVQRGVLLAGDNAFYDAVAQAMGSESAWVRLRRTAFGIEGEDGGAPTLREQVKAGLSLCIETAEVLAPVLQAEDALLVRQTVELIREVFNNERWA